MTTFLTDLDETTAKKLILSMTLTIQTLGDEIVQVKTEKSRKAKIARFQRLNGERVALIEAHNLQEWAAGLVA